MEAGSDVGQEGGRKRPRIDNDNDDDDEHGDQLSNEPPPEASEPIDKKDCTALPPPPPPPAYGSQEYWEARYKTQYSMISRNKATIQSEILEANKDEKVVVEEALEPDPDPFHAWYFSYKELAPILLPLILGQDGVQEAVEDEDESAQQGTVDDDDDNEDDDNENTDEKQDSKEGIRKLADDETGEVKDEDDVDGNDNDENSRQEDDDEEGSSTMKEDEEEDEEEEDEEEEAPTRMGLAKNGPISVLEVGCGDVPLGRDLAVGIMHLEGDDVNDHTKEDTKVSPPWVANQIIEKVICVDYSESVIQAMKEQDHSTNATRKSDNEDEACKTTMNKSSRIPVIYEVADARKLPYPDQHFQLILEKGTLDAMLSDKDLGKTYCTSIVAECARVLSIGGTWDSVWYLSFLS
jgi:hypothetical protein